MFLCGYIDFYMAGLPPETPVCPSDSPTGLDLAADSGQPHCS